MKKILKDKRLKYSAYSTVITIVVIAILILINLVVGQFNKSFDLTKENTYALSDETVSVLKNLDTNINIYTMFSTGASDAVLNKVKQVMEQYSQKSNRISVENIDLYLHPDYAKKYSNENTSIGVNSIVVESNDKYRVINYDDYYSQSESTNDEQINIEANITSAIQYVSNDISSKLYFITGHNETDYTHFTSLDEQLKLSNYETASINLLEKNIPDDCTAIVITPGERDFTAEEAEKIKNYLSNDGRALFLLGGTDSAKFTNLMSIVNLYGVTLEDGYVLEGDSEKYYTYPYAIFPSISDHSINQNVKNKGYTLYSVASQAIKILDEKKQGTTIEPLITTSEQSYIKADGNSSPNKENGDLEGPFNLAVAVTDDTYTDKSHSTKLVVLGTSYYFIDPNYDSMVVNANSTFVVSAINWLNDGNESVTISPKNISVDSVLIDSSSVTKIKIICWGVIPATLFVIGFVIWIVRRNK